MELRPIVAALALLALLAGCQATPPDDPWPILRSVLPPTDGKGFSMRIGNVQGLGKVLFLCLEATGAAEGSRTLDIQLGLLRACVLSCGLAGWWKQTGGNGMSRLPLALAAALSLVLFGPVAAQKVRDVVGVHRCKPDLVPPLVLDRILDSESPYFGRPLDGLKMAFHESVPAEVSLKRERTDLLAIKDLGDTASVGR